MSDTSDNKSLERPISRRDELESLRSLIVEPEQSEIDEIKRRLNDPKRRTEELSNIIAEAIVMRASKDSKLAAALLPTTETVLRDIVRRDPKFLADTIFPIIGPAIRKSISESLRSMVQSMSATLEYAFSWRGIKWRIESIRTGKPFAEIVLLNTLIYRMEQIFLIHKETGLVLQHVAADSAEAKDAGMVAAMLTAIQDFVNDSFSGKESSALQNLNLGDLSIWIEQGPRTVMAAVIRGNAPQEMRNQLQEIIEHIEFEYEGALDRFEGDAAPFEKCRSVLQYYLSQLQQTDRKAKKQQVTILSKSKEKRRREKDNPLVYIYIVAAVCLLIIILGFVFSII
ncbi:MAG: hypothetical protein JW901_00795 [Dehalococcoidia bacterium]|nr:hypothetical protein [Dehalococcoidia bacterium]